MLGMGWQAKRSVRKLCNFSLASQHMKSNEYLNYWEETRNLKNVYTFISYSVHVGTLAMSLTCSVSLFGAMQRYTFLVPTHP